MAEEDHIWKYEMGTFLPRVSDGKISGRGWADAAILMFRMAGGKLPLVLAAVHSFLMLEHQAIDSMIRS